MDFSAVTKVVYDRIQRLEPELVSKIIGFLLLQDNGESNMIRLAYGPESAIHSLISKVRSELGLSPRQALSISIPLASVNLGSSASNLPLQYTPFTPSRPFSSPAAIRAPSPYWERQLSHDQQPIQNLDLVPSSYADSLGEDYHLHGLSHFLTLEDQLETNQTNGLDFSSNYYYPEQTLGGLHALKASRRSPSLPEFPVKACLYFNKGYCKHGASCKFFHGQTMSDGFLQVINSAPNDMGCEEHVFSQGSLEKLEIELTELLKCTRGRPVSIASLPTLYFEKYGKNLQADGYLTESQRHGKAGYSLTKLLVRMNHIRLIDRPHGQHCVVLAEDASRYMDYKSERSDPGLVAAGARQIYLTFPAESTFSEQDVTEYFNIYGPVEDVRIPSQQKRMFGFVTFVYPETVKQILAKGNPHFVCGSRVLVKPYREKSKLVESRKYADRYDPLVYYSPNPFEIDRSQLHLMSRISENPRLLRNQMLEEHEQAFELERIRASKPLTQHTYFNYPPMEDLKLCEDNGDYSVAADRFNYLLDVINNGSTSDDKARNTSNSCTDQESSQGINLPESPFASPIASSISTVI